MEVKKLLDKLKNPTAEYRPAPFWSWNDKLDPEMLTFQIDEMKKTGHGGFFMHARGGLETEYLSDEWMDCIDACINEAEKNGVNAWAYDENGWPSGFADGKVPAMGKDYHMRWIEPIDIDDIKQTEADSSILGVYEYSDNKVVRLEGKTTGFNGKLIAVKQFLNPYYIDILNKDVVKTFIDETYDKYYSKFKNKFGDGLKGFFTDEPQYAREKIPWSIIFGEEFRKRYGYDVIDILPLLFLDAEGYEKARYDYWSLIQELFLNSYGKQIYDWCENHNCELTGHYVQEGSMAAQMVGCTGVMPFYEYMHIPELTGLAET